MPFIESRYIIWLSHVRTSRVTHKQPKIHCVPSCTQAVPATWCRTEHSHFCQVKPTKGTENVSQPRVMWHFRCLALWHHKERRWNEVQLRTNVAYGIKCFHSTFVPLMPSGYYMYHQSNIHKFYVLPTQCICVCCVDLKTNSDYFPTQH